MGANHTGTTQTDTVTNDTDRSDGKLGYVRIDKVSITYQLRLTPLLQIIVPTVHGLLAIFPHCDEPPGDPGHTVQVVPEIAYPVLLDQESNSGVSTRKIRE